MQRTTLILNEQSPRELKRVAADEGRTLSDIVDEILRTAISERKKARKGAVGRVKLPTFKTGRPRIDIARRESSQA